MNEQPVNPYASPTPTFEPQAGFGRPGPYHYVPPFRSLTGTMTTLVVVMVLELLATVVAIYCFNGQYHLLVRMRDGRKTTSSEIANNDTTVRGAFVASTLLQLVAAIVYLVFIRAAYTNLKALGVRQPATTPGWAVGGYFVPFLNFVQPYQVLQEIWAGSDPSQVPQAGVYRKPRGTPLIGVWWIGRMLVLFVNQFGPIGRTLQNASDLADLTALVIMLYIVCIPLDILLTYLVISIANNQDRRISTLERLGTGIDSPVLAAVVEPQAPPFLSPPGALPNPEPPNHVPDPWRNWPGQG